MARAIVVIVCLSGAVLVGALAAPARGQVKRAVATPAAPSPRQQAWSKAVREFARAVEKGDLGAAGALLAPHASVRPFDGTSDEEVWRMFERVMNGSLIAQHGYLHPPAAMAGDISTDFRGSNAIPEGVKARFFVEDDDGDGRRANATAVQWLEAQLGATRGALVGVVVLWVPREAAHEPVFVLLKGEESAGGGEPKIRQIVYGVPVN
jgi:hypothetical protein